MAAAQTKEHEEEKLYQDKEGENEKSRKQGTNASKKIVLKRRP